MALTASGFLDMSSSAFWSSIPVGFTTSIQHEPKYSYVRCAFLSQGLNESIYIPGELELCAGVPGAKLAIKQTDSRLTTLLQPFMTVTATKLTYCQQPDS